MKIGIEAQRIFRPRKHGMDMVALEVIKNLQEIDTQNEYVIFVNDNEDHCLQETPNFKIVTFSGSYPVWEQIELPKAAKEHGVDLLHCTSNTAPMNCPVPLVLTLHDIIYLEKSLLFTPGFTLYQRFGNLYRKYIVPKILKRCAKIITVSNFEKKRIGEKLHIQDDRLSYIYNGVSPHFQKITDSTTLDRIRKQYHLPENYFFFLGNTDPKKNTPRVLKAFLDFAKTDKDNYHLVIVDYEKTLVEEFLAQHKAETFIDRFRFPGYVKNTDLPAILTMAKIMLYPSLRESFGIPILEGMACATPVITSNTSSMPEVSGGAAFLVDPLNENEITSAIHQLIDDQKTRDELVEKGKVRAQQFSWRNTAKEVLKLYQDVYNSNS
ncbi:MAG: glycosyl transferase [Crocinitomicaceae bacterium]|nr:glycosyl transferase [Crocinitomicaceae bacterium]|tara:strand:+ start:18168 stop:19307 length:1140 start_codon:yes stop_codon:yes gene_type:complete